MISDAAETKLKSELEDEARIRWYGSSKSSPRSRKMASRYHRFTNHQRETPGQANKLHAHGKSPRQRPRTRDNRRKEDRKDERNSSNDQHRGG